MKGRGRDRRQTNAEKEGNIVEGKGLKNVIVTKCTTTQHISENLQKWIIKAHDYVFSYLNNMDGRDRSRPRGVKMPILSFANLLTRHRTTSKHGTH